MSSKTAEPISRRDFFRGVAGAAAGALASTIVVPPIIKTAIDNWNYDNLSLEDKFKDGGIGEFYPFYTMAKTGLERYRALPDYTFFSSSYFDLFSLLNTFDNSGGRMDQILSNRLKDGWATGLEETNRLAKAKAAALKIEIGGDVEDTEEVVRRAYSRLINVFPYHGLITPNKLVISGRGGEISWAGIPEPYIRAESPTRDLEGFFRTLMHELTHGEVNWTAGKPYIKKEDLIKYQMTRTKICFETFDTCFLGNWEDAKVFKEGQPLLMVTAMDPTLAETIRLEDRLRKERGIDVNMYKLDEGQMKDTTYRYNRYVYTVVNLGLTAVQKNSNDYDYNKCAGRVMEEIDHYLVGPIQREGLGLVGKNHPPVWPDSYLTKANETLNLARWRTYSTLSPQELIDFPTANAALRRRPGLGED